MSPPSGVPEPLRTRRRARPAALLATSFAVLAALAAGSGAAPAAPDGPGQDAPGPAPGDDGGPVPVEEHLRREIIEPGTALEEVRAFCVDRVARLPEFEGREAWDEYAERLRARVLEEVVLRGEAARWHELPTRSEDQGEVEGEEGYRIRKLRFEAVPGLWVPALLYEPEGLEGRVPAVLNVNGHDAAGKAAPYKQARCIHLARHGALALNVEWLGMGQLHTEGLSHYRMNQLDLCGTSGVAPFYLSLARALDILLAHEHADPRRVAVAGLSGGGWQTIFISALDLRVRLANPVAGYGSYVVRARHVADLGDSEQTPSDLAALADYTHLTALLAPRPSLLTYNAKDDCCFRAGHTLPPLVEAARPVYAFYGREDALRVHVNEDPGTHNFERDNRQALYAMLADHFGGDGFRLAREEAPLDAAIRAAEELEVELPEENADFRSIALRLSRGLPRESDLPADGEAAPAWRAARRPELASIIRPVEGEATGEQVRTERREGGGLVTLWRVRIGDDWTLPVTEIAPSEPAGTTVVVADEGRASSSAVARVEAELAAGRRVLAVDPFYLGASRIPERPVLYALLVASVGERPLGIQAGQLAAVARWAALRADGDPVRLVAVGPRTALAALCAAALEEEVDAVEARGAWGSLREVIERDLSVQDAPELFCFGLLESFDVAHIAALVPPREVRFPGAGDALREALAPLAEWTAKLGRPEDPFGDD